MPSVSQHVDTNTHMLKFKSTLTSIYAHLTGRETPNSLKQQDDNCKTNDSILVILRWHHQQNPYLSEK